MGYTLAHDDPTTLDRQEDLHRQQLVELWLSIEVFCGRTAEPAALEATGTIGSMLNVSQSKLLDLGATVPPIELQQRFAELVWGVLGRREEVHRAIEASEEPFESLLQRAFADVEEAADAT